MSNDRGSLLDIARFDPREADEKDLRAYLDITKEVIAEWSPDIPVPEYDAFVAQLGNPRTARGLRDCWVARRDGRVVGTAEIIYLEHENSRYGQAQVRVRRSARRQGVGRSLLAACLDPLQAARRDRVVAYNLYDGSPGLDWARDLGFIVTQRYAWQTLHVPEVDPDRWQVSIPEGYRIERWTHRAPEDLVSSFARARTAIGDAPTGASGIRAADWTAARVREREAQLASTDREHRYLVVVHEPTGTVAGLTEVAMQPYLPNTCFQGDTAVLAEHRGRGLGRVMKASMMQWLLADKPDLLEIRTTTAADNRHMIRVNTQLGYTTTATLNTMEIPVHELELRLSR